FDLESVGHAELPGSLFGRQIGLPGIAPQLILPRCTTRSKEQEQRDRDCSLRRRSELENIGFAHVGFLLTCRAPTLVGRHLRKLTQRRRIAEEFIGPTMCSPEYRRTRSSCRIM